MNNTKSAGENNVANLFSKGIGLQMFLFLISLLLLHSGGYSQDNLSGYLSFKQQKTITSDFVDNQTLNSFLNPTEETSDQIMSNNSDLPVPSGNGLVKSRTSESPILDSIIEEKRMGYFCDQLKWYFYYEPDGTLSSSKCFYYNTRNQLESKSETWLYDSEGRVISYVVHNVDSWVMLTQNDTTIIEVYSELSTWKDGKLSHKSVKNNDVNSYEEDYSYNENGQIIDLIRTSSSGFSSQVVYLYDNHGELEYQYYSDFPYASGNFRLSKYGVENRDSTKITTISFGNGTGNLEKKKFDTFMNWYFKEHFEETFNKSGLRSTIKRACWSEEEGDFIDYKASFIYTDNGDLSEAIFYAWQGSIDSGDWKESVRINNRYIQEGNLSEYTKTYFDDRTSAWEIEDHKAYYYTYPQKNVVESDKNNNKLTIFPNPISNQISIQNLDSRHPIYTLYNLKGSVVQSGKIENNILNVEFLSPGLYFLRVETIGSVTTFRFIKI
jgi:hypothetical protein